VLLSSELEARQLFANSAWVIVNYELHGIHAPLEQRSVGVDRLGIKKPEVVILNLNLRGTIDDYLSTPV